MAEFRLVQDNTSTRSWAKASTATTPHDHELRLQELQVLQELIRQEQQELQEQTRSAEERLENSRAQKGQDFSTGPSVDETKPQGHTQPMNDISRSELDTKLQLIEERLDRKVSDIAASVETMKASNKSTLDALGNAKWWAIGTAIAVLTVFLGTLQWGLTAQKEENARFSGYIREDVKSIGDDMKDVAKTLTEIRVKLEPASNSK